jgi:AbrB family looped-hinge helix DNA binding protein
MAEKAMSRIVQLPSRGQITIPAEFRRELGLDEGTLLRLTLKERTIEIEAIAASSLENPRLYAEEEIRRFLDEDKIDEGTAQAVRRLLAAGAL